MSVPNNDLFFNAICRFLLFSSDRGERYMLILLIVIAFLVSHHCLNFLFTIQTKFGFNWLCLSGDVGFFFIFHIVVVPNVNRHATVRVLIKIMAYYLTVLSIIKIQTLDESGKLMTKSYIWKVKKYIHFSGTPAYNSK